MENLRSAKIRAALVMIAWLATVASLWGMTAAGNRAIKDTECKAKDTRNRVVQLHKSPDVAVEALKTKCVRQSVRAQLVEDTAFLLSYGALNFTLFLFAAGLRGHGRALALLGLLLAAAMAAGDAFENRNALEVIRLVGEGSSGQAVQEPLRLLQLGSWIKWIALGLASGLLAWIWPKARLAWIPKVLGLAAAVAVFAGLALAGWKVLNASMIAIFAFWIAALVHAIAVAVTVEPGPAPATRSEGEKK